MPRNRLRIPISSRATEARDDSLQKAHTFARSLSSSLARFHEHSSFQPRKANIVTLLSEREMNCAMSLTRTSEALSMVHMLVQSDTRQYVPCEMFRLRGKAQFEDRRIIIPSGREVVNTDNLDTFDMHGIESTEKVVSTMTIDGTHSDPCCSVPPIWLVVLTDRGRIIIYNRKTGEKKYIFQLPAHTHKFKRLGWNKAYSEFFVYGVSIPMHIDDDAESAVGDHAVRQAFCEKRIAMAVFEIQPVRFKGMVQFDKKKFSNAYGAVLENDVLVTFCNSPHRVIIYSFDEIYKQNCIQTYEPFELSDGKQVLPFNIEVTSQITKLFELKGNYCSVYFGGSLRYILCEPTSQRESYVLRDLRDAQVTPLMHDLRLRGPNEGSSFAIDFSNMLSHLDDSTCLLRFEGVHLACYTVQSVPDGSNREEVRVLWRTALLPGKRLATDGKWLSWTARRESTMTSYGRTSRAVYRVGEETVAVRVMSMSYDGDRMLHLLVCYDIANLGGIMYSGAEPDSEWVSLMFSLDSSTGRIINITPMQAHGAELFTDQFTIDVEDDMMASTSYDGKNTTIEIYRLVETDADKWQSEVSKRSPKKFVRSAMSRKERRKRRVGELASSYLPDSGRSVIPR